MFRILRDVIVPYRDDWFSVQLIGLVVVFIYAVFGLQFFANRSEVTLFARVDASSFGVMTVRGAGIIRYFQPRSGDASFVHNLTQGPTSSVVTTAITLEYIVEKMIQKVLHDLMSASLCRECRYIIYADTSFNFEGCTQMVGMPDFDLFYSSLFIQDLVCITGMARRLAISC